MIKNIAFPALVILFLLAVNVSAFEYNNIYYISGSSGTNILTNPVSFFSENGDVVLDLNMRSSFNFSASSISYNGNFESPYSTIFGITSGTVISNQSCLNLGTASKSYASGNIIESRTTMTNDATSATIYSQSSFNVTTSDRFLEIFSYNNTDSEEFVPNIYKVVTGIATEPPTTGEITTHLSSANFANCANTGSLTRFPGSYTAAAQQEFGYVVLNSTAGVINYSMATGTPAPNARWVYYPIDDVASVTDLGTGTTKSGSVTLDKNRLYVFAYGTVGVSGSRSAPDMNFTVDLGLANYVCPAFGECIDDVQERICVDANGLQPDKIETRICSLVVLENATLGFENSTTIDTVLKCEPQWFPILGCFYNIANVTLDRPGDWVIVDPAYGNANFLQMTQEYATEGTRSLKMWQIPPKQGEVIDASTCGNLTSSIIPTSVQVISNTTFSVVHNVTFPATNMQISFDVKKCDSQVLQHSALLDEGFFFNVTFCNQRCYANDCSVEPKGGYVFNIVDPATSLSIFGAAQYEDAQLNTLSPTYDLSNLGIVPGKPYFLVFAISNENPNDATGTCVYFDNVQYEVTTENILTLVPNCESRCIGSRRIEASRTLNGSCFTVEQDPSPLCSDQATATAIENQENYCSSISVLQTFIEKSAQHEPISCSEGFVCNPFPVQAGIPGSCIPEAEAETQPTETEDISTLIDDALSALVTKAGIAIFAIIILTLLAAVGLGQLGAKSEKVPLAVGLTATIGFTMFLWLPAVVGVIIAAIISFLIVREFQSQ